MKKCVLYIFVIWILGGCTSSSQDHKESGISINRGVIDTMVNVNEFFAVEETNIDQTINDNAEFFALANKISLPTEFNLSSANSYFDKLIKLNLPLVEESVIDEAVKKDILNILKKNYSNEHEVSQYFFNNEYAYYRMLGMIENERSKVVSKIIYYEALTTEGIHIGFLLMINMDYEMEINLSNAVLAFEIGAEAGAPYFIKLSSELDFDAQHNIVIKQKYQIDDAKRFLENTERTIIVTKDSVSYGLVKNMRLHN